MNIPSSGQRSRVWFIWAIVIIAAFLAFSFVRTIFQSTGAMTGMSENSLSQYAYGGNGAAPAMDMATADSYAMAPGSARSVSVDGMKMMPPIEPPRPTPGYESGGGEEYMPADRLIIKTGYMSVFVKDVQEAIASVAAYAAANKGYEVTRNVYKQGEGFSGTITIRIPVASFEASLASVRGLGEVTSQSVSGQDVTEEFVDVAAQLGTLKATEEQFLAILRRAEKIEDILSVQRELTTVRTQIERLEGRKKYLEQSAALSTLTVNVSTDPANLPVVNNNETWKPIAVIKDALRSLVEFGKTIFAGIVWVVIFLPVWALIFAVIWFMIRFIRRRFGM